MRSADRTADVARLGVLTAAALALGYAESLFVIAPSVPGIRLGLGNTAILIALYARGGGAAALIMLLKVTLSSLLFGNASGFFYSLAGGALSVAGMWALSRVRGMGLTGISVGGATLHMTAQLLVSRILLMSWACLPAAPYLILCAVVTGFLTGKIAVLALRALSPGNERLKRKRRNPDD